MSTIQSQSSTDLVIFDNANQNGGPASAAVPDFDLIQINEMKETGFHSKPANNLVNQKSLISRTGLSTVSKDTRGGGKTVGTPVNVKKKSRAQKAINVFKTQTSTSASNKEKKVTKTLAIVLIVFLVCW